MERSAQGSSPQISETRTRTLGQIAAPRQNPSLPDQNPETREFGPSVPGQSNLLTPQIAGARQFHAPVPNTNEVQSE
jgi:hypothetical protein